MDKSPARAIKGILDENDANTVCEYRDMIRDLIVR